LEDLARNGAEKWRVRAAIDFYDHRISFDDLYKAASRVARGLQDLGVADGDRVVLHLPNTPHFIVCAFGIWLAGGCVAVINPQTPAQDLYRQVAEVGAKVVITMTPSPGGEAGWRAGTTVVACALTDFIPADLAHALVRAGDFVPAPSTHTYAALIGNDGRYRPRDHGALDHAPALIAFTGGTTGTPKGAVLTHANLAAIVHMRKRWIEAAGVDCNTRALVILPVSHIFGFTIEMLMCIATGVEMVLHFKFDARKILGDIAAKKIYFFSGVPTMYAVLVNHSQLDKYDLSSLRICGVGGAPVAPSVAEKFHAKTGLTLLDAYGLTEMAPVVTMQRLDIPPRRGAVGLPAPLTAVGIVDLEDRSRVLGTGEIGEVRCTGPQLMKGYWQNPAATAAVIEDGWLYTGDMGYLDADGYLYIVDRKKDLVFVAGHNVFPGKVEKAVMEHPALEEAAVIGIPDAYFGHRLKAFVVLKADVSGFHPRELERFLAGKLAAYEVPTLFEVRTALPKTNVGKISKRDLLQEELAKTREVKDGH
jgi:long-chain acyl-CoA synthetase